jgi:hypothetical protein
MVSTAGITVGMGVTGAGIPANTIVIGVSGVNIVLSASATATGAGVALTFSVAAIPGVSRHVFPKCSLIVGARSFADEAAILQFTGTSYSNPAFGFGPGGASDWPAAAAMGTDTGYGQYFEDAVPASVSGGRGFGFV